MAPKVSDLLKFLRDPDPQPDAPAEEEGQPQKKPARSGKNSAQKRPSGSPAGALMKKPSAAPAALPDETGVAGQDNDEEGDTSGTRDRNKAHAFKKMLADFPPYIQDMYKEALQKPGSRQAVTAMINLSLEPTAGAPGRYSIALDKPMFNEAKHRYERKFGRDTSKGPPARYCVVSLLC